MRYILALDQSTSATKALLFDEDGHCVDRESRAHVQHYPEPGWVEHDAEEIWRNVRVTLHAILARQSAHELDIVGLSLTNQRETIVIFERVSGHALCPAIVWQCRRSESLCAAHVAAGREELVHSRTGLKIDPYFSGSKLQWLAQARPEIHAKLVSGEALIGTIDTFLIYRLTRGAVFATDSTNASRTLLFDIGKLRWDEELCALWEVPVQALAEVRESFAQFGETTLDGALKQPLPICGVMGDSQAALFAHRCFELGSAKVTLGTGCSILLNVGSELRLSQKGVLTTIAWVRQGTVTYAVEGIIVSAASTLTWLRDQLRLIDDLAEVEQLATSVPDNGGVYLVPAFSGYGFPHWAPSARGTLVGLSNHSDRRHVVRAALEAIAYQIRDALIAMRAEAAIPAAAVRCDGGATSNTFLTQFIADMTRATLEVAQMPDCSALGAARAGLIGLGVLNSFQDRLALSTAHTLVRPRLDEAAAAQLERGWRQAVRQTILPLSTN
jgi:glycerol kinase